MNGTKSPEGILRGLLDLYGCAIPRAALDPVLSVLQARRSPRWQFGISEFSLSFDRSGPPRVRAMAEVLTGAPTVPADGYAIREIGGHLFDALQRQHRMPYDTALFDDLVMLAYGTHFPRFRPPKLRFGAAVEWRAGRSPSVKCYFDLFAGGQHGAADRLRQVFDRLQFGRQWPALRRLLEDGDEAAPCRIVGVDFAPGGARNMRLYLPGSRYPLPRIRRLLADCGGEHLDWQLDAFNSQLLGGLSGAETARGMLLGLAYSDRSPAQPPVVKLDGFLPDHHADDFAAADAVAALAARLDIPLPGHAEALRILAPDTPLAGTQRLQQYCSLDLLSAPKLNLYFRPMVTRSEHLALSQRPRVKPALLADLDAACRTAIAALERRPAHLDAGGAIALLQAGAAGFGIDRGGVAGALARAVREPIGEVGPLAPRMQLALLAKAPAAGALCDDALALLFDPGEAGAGTGASDDRRRAEIGRWCAEGAALEDMAQLAYALALRADVGSMHAARAIAGFLGARQHFDGLWRGAAPGEEFRTTFLVVRALCRLLPEQPMLARTARALREAQHSDGGWGAAGADPMTSAQALSACALLHDLDPEGAPALARGIAYLLREQQPDGHWSGRPAATAACLDALVSARKLVEQGLGAGAAARRPVLRVVQPA